MDKTLKIATLISTDIRSRSNADKIRSAIGHAKDKVVLDFSDVTFISRSFADELYNVADEHGNLHMANMNDMVNSMLNAVYSGRHRKRSINTDKSDMKSFCDMESLSAFLATI